MNPRYVIPAIAAGIAIVAIIVMINGEPADFDEKESQLASHRTITVSYGAGEKTIEIIGTSVIPEFGSISLLILVISIITVVVISRKKIQLTNNFLKF